MGALWVSMWICLIVVLGILDDVGTRWQQQ